MSGDLGENAIGLTSKGDDIEAIRVAVTGGAGNIGYALLWRIASGIVSERSNQLFSSYWRYPKECKDCKA